MNLTERTHIQEAAFNDERREAVITVIKAGESKNNRVYTRAALEDLLPLIEERRKVYLDHARDGDPLRERSLKDWVATIQEARIEGNAIIASITVHDEWLWKRMKDAPEEIGVSIDAIGILETPREGAPEVVAIKQLNSVDFVTRPAAGGKLDLLLASDRGEAISGLTPCVTLTEAFQEDPFTNIALAIEGDKARAMNAERERMLRDRLIEERIRGCNANEEERGSLRAHIYESTMSASFARLPLAITSATRAYFETAVCAPQPSEAPCRAITALEETIMRNNRLNPENEDDVRRFKETTRR